MKYSIKRQITFIFGGIMTGVLVLCWLVNSLYAGRFYEKYKQKELTESYQYIDKVVDTGNLEKSSYDTEFELLSEKNNMEIIVLDTDTKTVKSTFKDSRMISRRLIEYIIYGSTDAKTVYANDDYTIQVTHDPGGMTQYLELFGLLSDGKMVLLRTPMEGIKESAGISNLMMTYIGIFGIICGMIIIWLVSKKVTQPILELADISSRMTNLDFDAKYSSGGHNEIAVLGEHINELSERLEATISDLKTANDKLKYDLDKKIELEEMRTEFLSSVSHELKTPIALIQGYAEGLKDNVNSDEESRNFYCDVIIDESKKMNTLVKSLLELNELENSKEKLNIENFDLSLVIKNCISNIKLLAEQNEVCIIFNENEPIYVKADEFKTEQIINNYLANAIHYAKNEKKVEVSVKERGQLAHIEVFNTGDNIPDSHITKLWDKFYKVDKARTREYGGSGIGLSIVKAIADSFGREYGVYNKENGVVFWFELEMGDNS